MTIRRFRETHNPFAGLSPSRRARARRIADVCCVSRNVDAMKTRGLGFLVALLVFALDQLANGSSPGRWA